ncbi:MAG: ABC transporter substrate-binding protein [Planctomycetes bacterium]|nr:ABC transporter substrate-binding protein [Planctomycetota bacterium]
MLALFACFLSPASCERAPARTVAPDQPRIVAFSPAVGIILSDLGYADRIVGRHGFDDFLPREIPACGDQGGIDYERLINMSPTLMFTQWGLKGTPDRLTEIATKGHWRLQDVTLLSLDDIARAAGDIDAAVCGSSEPSAQLKALRERMNAAWARRAGLENVGRVLLLGNVNPPAAFGPGSCHHDILLRLGAVPAIQTGAAWITLDFEDIRTLAPDAIVLVEPRMQDAAPTTARAALGAIAEVDTPAKKRGRFALIDDPKSQIPSTSMIEFADALARTLEAWK